MTGDKAPATGIYRLVRHTDNSIHESPNEQNITLIKGETFPPCRSDNKVAYWSLELYA
jgi:hypothetical protein